MAFGIVIQTIQILIEYLFGFFFFKFEIQFHEFEKNQKPSSLSHK